MPGLPELVEIHIRRLGQTGEQTAVTQTLAGRARILNISSYSYRVLSPEHRIIVSTLQRCYRHFYIRLCDVVDNAHLVDTVQWTSITCTSLSHGDRNAGRE